MIPTRRFGCWCLQEATLPTSVQGCIHQFPYWSTHAPATRYYLGLYYCQIFPLPGDSLDLPAPLFSALYHDLFTSSNICQYNIWTFSISAQPRGIS
ncbi:hypothetical protein RSAG8_03221, partial [Rhizoctonia solani AG-8 WAC10335]